MKQILMGLGFCLLLLPAAAYDLPSDYFYVSAKFNGLYQDNQDMNNFTKIPGSSGPQYLPAFYLGGGFAVGFHFDVPISLELGVDFGPYRSFSADWYSKGSLVQHADFNNSLTVFYAEPRYSLSPKDSPFNHSLGIKLGTCRLDGNVRLQNYSPNQSGSYQQLGASYMLGASWRSEYMFARGFSLGLELGYQYANVYFVQDQNGSGAYNGLPNGVQELNSDGSSASFYFSGPYLQLTLSGILDFL